MKGWLFTAGCRMVLIALSLMSNDAFSQNRIPDGGTETEEVAPDIFRVMDGSNSYIIRYGNSALLIDAGSPDLLTILKEAGIRKVEWVLHTHYHRDQCVADRQLREAGASVAIGKSEAQFLGPATTGLPFTLSDRNSSQTLPEWGKMAPVIKPGVDRTWSDGDEITWNDCRIRIINTPGHTAGSISYAVYRGGAVYCFTGDLIMAGGYVADLYSMQWNYLENPGIDSSLTSLGRIKRLGPSLLLPSHGDIIRKPEEEIEVLAARLKQVQRALHFERAERWNWSDFIRVSAHVVQDCGTTSQFVISPGGEALMFDCGADMTPERLESVKKSFGIKRIAVIIPSHWHYDHVNGIPAIVVHENSQVWAWKELAEHLEHPARFPTTCWSGLRIPVDCILEPEFSWAGYKFTVYPNPVHMQEQMALSSVIDGLKFIFMADGSAVNREGNMRSALHGYNGIVLPQALIGTAMSFNKTKPYICVPAHSNSFAVREDAAAEFLQWAVNTTDAIRSILPPGFQEAAFNPYWASFYPARTIAMPGDRITLSLRIRNDSHSDLSGIFTLNGDALPFTSQPYPFQVSAGEVKDIEIESALPAGIKPGIYVVTANIRCNGRLFREFAEAYLELDTTP